MLPSIRSTFNIGSIFRTADGCGVAKMYLTGISARPDKHPKIAKTALGSEKTVPWEYVYRAATVIQRLKDEGYQIVALEKNTSSVQYQDWRPMGNKIAIVVGNEKTGVSSAMLKSADAVVHLPMVGEKESLNVAVATSILLYHLCFER